MLVAGYLQHPVHRAGRDGTQRLSPTRHDRVGGDDLVRGQAGDSTGQESRSADLGIPPSVMAMDITIHSSFLPHTDPDASLAFYRDVLGFEVRLDVGQGTMRWLTIGPPNQPDTSIVLHPPAVDPGVTDDERRTISEMMAKGTYGVLLLASDDVDGAFEQLTAHDLDVVQE